MIYKMFKTYLVPEVGKEGAGIPTPNHLSIKDGKKTKNTKMLNFGYGGREVAPWNHYQN